MAFSFDDVDQEDPEPGPDVGICSACGWRGSVDECEKGQDGDWETGYHEIDMCPECEDGGCVDDYSYSAEQIKKISSWRARNKEK